MHTIIQNGEVWTVCYQYSDNNGNPIFTPLRDFASQGEAADYCSWINGGGMPMWGGPIRALHPFCRSCVFWRVDDDLRAKTKKMWKCQKHSPSATIISGTSFTVWPMVYGYEGCGDWRKYTPPQAAQPTAKPAPKL